MARRFRVSVGLAGKRWRCELHRENVSKSEALDLLRGFLLDLEAEVVGEARRNQLMGRCDESSSGQPGRYRRGAA